MVIAPVFSPVSLVVSSAASRKQSNVLDHRILSLHLAEVPVINPPLPNQVQTIAWYLRTIFPSLQQFTWHMKNKDGPDLTKGWSYVSSRLSSGELLEIPIAEEGDAPAGEQS